MAFADPTQNVAQFRLEPGMTVVDLGAGPGAYEVPLARSVMPGGKVYAVDVQKDLLVRLKSTLAEKNIENVNLIWADVEVLGGTKLGDGLADVVLISNTLFLAENKHGLALEAKRLLKREGRLILIDWVDTFGGVGPAPEQVVKRDQAQKLFEQAGLVFASDFQAGDHHYGLIFKRI